MDSAELLAIAASWSHWTAPPRPSVRRRVRLPAELRPDLALVVQGVRRCGKSTLLAQLVQRYSLDPQRCVFVNFEDPRLAAQLDHTVLQALVTAFEAERKGPVWYFFDEIQRVDGWQRWLRSQLDRPGDRRFIVTGSNAHLLSGELASTLTGRHHRVELFPFSFDEFRELRPDASLSDYLASGGFPAPATSPDGERLLRSYFNDIVERDVRERVGARSTQPLRHLVQMLYESAGSELSVRRIAAALGIAADTASLYLDAVENAYLAFACPWFAWSAKKQAGRNKKYYPIDHGLRRIAVVAGGGDRGKNLECATFVLLRQRCARVCYWRDRGEVDFVVEDRGKVTPVQVGLEGPQERHQRALDEFYAQHPHAEEAVFVGLADYERGIPEVTGDA
jgi:predicted AAA+ superfamily ATPase